MNTKSTPGPWQWMRRGPGEAPYLATPDRGHLYVMGFARKGMQRAQPIFAHWTGIEGGADRGRMGGVMCDGILLQDGSLHPDARLIEAAPKLLAALTKCMAALSYYDNNLTSEYPTGVDVNAPNVVEAQQAGEEAIAAATGSAP